MEDCVVALGPCLIEQGLCFDKAEYEIIRNSILKHLLAYGAMTLDELSSLAEEHLRRKFADSVIEHYAAVRQDLEGRGEIRRIPGTRPPLIELTE